jgi:hypothetical protein
MRYSYSLYIGLYMQRHYKYVDTLSDVFTQNSENTNFFYKSTRVYTIQRQPNNYVGLISTKLTNPDCRGLYIIISAHNVRNLFVSFPAV